jgi:hypothetical protein
VTVRGRGFRESPWPVVLTLAGISLVIFIVMNP